jgi:hypothetical protein
LSRHTFDIFEWLCSAHEVFIDEDQLAWFEATLQRCGSRPVVVCTHVRTAALESDPLNGYLYTCLWLFVAARAAHGVCIHPTGTAYGLWSTGCAGGVPFLPPVFKQVINILPN